MDGLLIVLLMLALAAAAWLLLWPAVLRIRAFLGGWRVHYLLKRSLPAQHFTVLRDITLSLGRADGQPAARIDHVVVSPYGVFVIATNHCSGGILGAERAAHWTRVRWGSRRTFPNPLRRTAGTVRALQELCGLDASRFHPLVVFTGGARFETPMPVNVTHIGGLIPFIGVRNSETLGFEEAERIASLMRSSHASSAMQTPAEHLAALKASHGSRLSAQQAMLGLGLMAMLLIAAGTLVHRLTEIPGRYPSLDTRTAPGASPFVADSAPPRIDLPGVAGRATPAKAAPVAPEASGATQTEAHKNREAAAPAITGGEGLLWESTLMCAYAAQSRRCACYDLQGRKAMLDYDNCRILADRSTGAVAGTH